MIEEFVPTVKELKEQEVQGDPDEIVNDTKEAIALQLSQVGANVDVSGIDYRRRRAPWWFRSYRAGNVRIGAQVYPVDSIDRWEVRAWFIDLIATMGAYNVDVRTSPAEFQALRLTYRYSWELFKWFRVVRKQSGLPYQGNLTLGNGLVIDKILAVDFDKTDWLSTPTTTGATDFVGTSSTPMTLGTKQGLAIYGYIDEIVLDGEESPVDQVIVTKAGNKYPSLGLDFKMADGVEDAKGAFLFVPNDSIYMQIDVNTANKTTKFHPIGVVLIPVDKAKTLATNRIKA